ncbi:hypothetical protein GCM10027024_31120 [Microbacterium insulae]
MTRATLTHGSWEPTNSIFAGATAVLLAFGLLLSTADSATAADSTLRSTAEAVPAATFTAGSDGHGIPSGGGEFLPVATVLGGTIIVGGVLVIVLRVARERRRREKAVAVAASRRQAQKDVQLSKTEGGNHEMPD